MKNVGRTALMIGALALGANGLLAAEVRDNTFNKWFEKKYGTVAPLEAARIQAERATEAFREAAPAAAPNWIENHFRGKLGRPTPGEEARLRTDRENTAFREAPAGAAVNWIDAHLKGKLGRPSGR